MADDGSRKAELAKAATGEEGSVRRSGFNPDDTIGRVAIQLGRLVGGCEYDSWFPLGLGAIDEPNGSKGHVRLRFSVTFKSERVRMLQYLQGAPPTHIVPLHKSSYRVNARFAKRGQLASEAYDWDILMVYVDELKIVRRSQSEAPHSHERRMP